MVATDLIIRLRDEKGINFQIMNEADAEQYLINKNNYLRTASYRKNYDKHHDGENKGKYINLDFAYLTEMSTLDMYFRSLILPMCIDIEHAIKVRIISEIEKNNVEDGYTIVNDFLNSHPDVLHSIEEKSDSIFTGELINKYFKLCSVFEIGSHKINTRILSVDCPVWVFVELIGFHSLISFVNFYNSKYPGTFNIDSSIMNPVRSLRNACAHNNCIFNSMRPNSSHPPQQISLFISAIPTVLKEERKNKLSCRPLFEFVCLLYIYKDVVTEKVRNKRLKELQSFTNGRLLKHIDYFSSNQTISTSFDFIRKVVDDLV